MPYDITLCRGEHCPIKQKCYRFTLEVLGRHNFWTQAPYNSNTNSCEYFISSPLNQDEIRLKAYEIWQKMGYPDDKSIECWLQAEKELM